MVASRQGAIAESKPSDSKMQRRPSQAFIEVRKRIIEASSISYSRPIRFQQRNQRRIDTDLMVLKNMHINRFVKLERIHVQLRKATGSISDSEPVR